MKRTLLSARMSPARKKALLANFLVDVGATPAPARRVRKPASVSALGVKRGRGRPPRSENLATFREDLLIARVVEYAVYLGLSYRDSPRKVGATTVGALFADKYLGRKLGADAVEAIVERIVGACWMCHALTLPDAVDERILGHPESLMAMPPTKALRSLVSVFGPFRPGLAVRNGDRRLRYKPPEPFLPDGEDSSETDAPRLRRIRD